MADLVLRHGLLADGSAVDVTVEDGRISVVGDPTADEGEDLRGRLLLPAMGEPHAHLDKAFTADVLPNPAGDLLGAIAVVRAGWRTIEPEDIARRAAAAVRRLAASGTTAVRTHADTNLDGGLKSVEALVAVREEVAGLCYVEVAALAWPVTGPDARPTRLLLDRAMEAGADLVGGAPHLDFDPPQAIEHALTVAKAAGCRVDLHLDEVLDPGVENLPHLARRVVAHGLEGRVTASHCVSHGLQTAARQREVAAMLAGAGVAVVTNPRTNLFLQARGVEQAPPRGLAGVRALLDEGVTVAAGADNVQDPFYVIGRSDPLETASLLVSVAHLSVEEAWRLVSAAPREVMGLEPLALEPGSPADLVAIRAGSVRQAVADQPEDRLVVQAGRVVARTVVERTVL